MPFAFETGGSAHDLYLRLQAAHAVPQLQAVYEDALVVLEYMRGLLDWTHGKLENHVTPAHDAVGVVVAMRPPLVAQSV
jgi:hypothetical protein